MHIGFVGLGNMGSAMAANLVAAGHDVSAYNRSQEKVDAVAANGGIPPQFETFHPTFLYECLWNLAAFALIIWLDRRFRLGHGRVMAVYVMAYTQGRGWIEDLRIDDVQLNNVLGLRFNVWTSIVLFVLAAAYFVWATKNRPGREESVYVDGRRPVAETPEHSEPEDGASTI